MHTSSEATDLRPIPTASKRETPIASCRPVAVLPCEIIRLRRDGVGREGVREWERERGNVPYDFL